MQEISSLLRQRLGARQAPQTHPDPDLLTAYVEQALGEVERAEVVRHLASCSDCREVVSLSLPEQPAQPVPQPTAAGRQFWNPAFRWSAALATVAIAAALVIEKPWHRTPGPDLQSQQRAPVTVPAQAPASAPITTLDNKSQTAAGSGAPAGLAANLESKKDRARVTAEESLSFERAAPAPRRAHPAKTEVQNEPIPQLLTQVQQPRPLAMAHPALAPPAQPPAKDNARTGFVNADVLNQAASNETVNINGQDATDITTNAASLPPAPTPKAGAGGNAQQPLTPAPAITGGQVAGNTFDYNLQTPQMEPSKSTPPDDKNTLEKMKFAQKVKTKITESAKAMARLGAAPPPAMSQGFSSFAGTSDVKPAETDRESRRASLQFHWRVTPDGILMKSTDLSQWHEAYPQGSDLQFRAVFALGQGRQVWAGGNNGMLIHSWNGGVNWDTLKVPEAGSNDITSITIDDGWQIKTSDGQTLVSHDQGKTWVPLKQN